MTALTLTAKSPRLCRIDFRTVMGEPSSFTSKTGELSKAPARRRADPDHAV